MMYLVWVGLVGILAGWLAGQITKGRGFGLLGDLILEACYRICCSAEFAGPRPETSSHRDLSRLRQHKMQSAN